MSTLPVVEQILRETAKPMSVREIVEYANGRLPTKSKTPDTVVARDLSMDIKRKGEDSLFERTAPGRYAIKKSALDSVTPVVAAVTGERAGPKPARAGTQPPVDVAIST